MWIYILKDGEDHAAHLEGHFDYLPIVDVKITQPELLQR